MKFHAIWPVFALVLDVYAHGVVTTPAPRQLGPVALDVCGNGVYNELKSDIYGPIENAVKKIDNDYDAEACHLYFCRGYQTEDNAANAHVYIPGTVVPFSVDIEAHHTGTANVSIVDLTSQATIGAPLIDWPVYANDSLGPADQPLNETAFSVTIPELGAACSTPGKCAIQWYWWAYNGQTYESCVDFSTA